MQLLVLVVAFYKHGITMHQYKKAEHTYSMTQQRFPWMRLCERQSRTELSLSEALLVGAAAQRYGKRAIFNVVTKTPIESHECTHLVLH